MQDTGFNGHCLSLELLHCPTTIPYCSNKHPWVFATQTLKMLVGSCMEEVLEWFNYPRTSAHPRSKANHIVTSSLVFKPDKASPMAETAVYCA